MDGPFHYREAERLLHFAVETHEGQPADTNIARAQVHATLALTMAVAFKPGGEGGINDQAWKEWVAAADGSESSEPGQVEPEPAGVRVIQVERGALVMYPEWNGGEPVKVLGVAGAGLEGRLVAVRYTFFGARDGEEVAVVSGDTLVIPYGGGE